MVQVLLTNASGMTTQHTFRGKEGASPEDFERALGKFIDKLEDKASDKDFNTARKGKPPGGDIKQSAEIAAFVKKLTAILAPAAVLASIIGSETGGMKIFMGSIKVLGNVIGTAFAPIMFMGAAAVLSLADMISDWLLPNLDKWYEWLVTTGFELFRWLEDEITKAVNGAVDKINLLAEAIGKGIEMLKQWKDSLDPKKSTGAKVFDVVSGGLLSGRGTLDLLKRFGVGGGLFNLGGANPGQDKTAEFGKAVDNLLTGTTPEGKGTGGKFSDKVWEALGMKTDKNGRPILNPPGGFTGRMQNNLKEVINEYRIQNAPQAQRMGIAEAAKNAQLAALQMSPFESRMLKLVEKVADSMEKAAAKLPPPPTTE